MVIYSIFLFVSIKIDINQEGVIIFESIFEHAAIEDINPIVMNGISTKTANHDFFSQVGAGYLMGDAEAMTDDDYDF